MLRETRQFFRASDAVSPGPTSTMYWSKATSKIVPVESTVAKAWPTGQPEPMALTLTMRTELGSGATASRGIAATKEDRKRIGARSFIVSDFCLDLVYGSCDGLMVSNKTMDFLAGGKGDFILAVCVFA